MRRERGPLEDYVKWLKSIGCVLYLPFGENGDMTDRISGNGLVYTGTGTQAQWDPVEGMYLFTGPQYHTITYTLQTGWSAATFATNEVTVLTTFRKHPNTGQGNGIFFDCGNYTPIGCACMQNGTAVLGSWNNNLYQCAYALSSSGRWLYDNGALLATYGAHLPYLPANWGGYSWYVGSYNSANNGRKVYVKDIMMFNRVLSAAEVAIFHGS